MLGLWQGLEMKGMDPMGSGDEVVYRAMPVRITGRVAASQLAEKRYSKPSFFYIP
jgi:hypothetical protein